MSDSELADQVRAVFDARIEWEREPNGMGKMLAGYLLEDRGQAFEQKVERLFEEYKRRVLQ